MSLFRAFKRGIKRIVRPPKYRILEKPQAQIERIVQRHVGADKFKTIKLILHATDSVVADVNDAWIFKFPRQESSAQQIEKEALVLAYFGTQLSLAIPRMTIHAKQYFYSCHAKVPGSVLTTQDYQNLTDDQRNALAETLAVFFSQMHATPMQSVQALHLEKRGPWKPSPAIIADVEEILPAHILPYVRRTMERFDAENARREEEVVGHFDAHGENMAFDLTGGRLNGIFDFADVGIGDYHKELQAPSWISPDLTERIVPRYEALSGRTVNRDRLAINHAAAQIINVAFSKGIRPEVAAHFVSQYETGHMS